MHVETKRHRRAAEFVNAVLRIKAAGHPNLEGIGAEGALIGQDVHVTKPGEFGLRNGALFPLLGF